MSSAGRLEDYVCARCGGPLRLLDPDLECVGCAQVYPTILGIPVLLHRPTAALRGNEAALAQSRLDARDVERRAAWALADHATERLAQRVERWRSGTALNLELVERYMAPIAVYLERSPASEAPNLLDFASSWDVGWSPSALLPYFYQDWCEGTGFDEVRRLVTSALTRHAARAQKVAVLGAGACGLAHALSSECEVVHAVDLCLPVLLMAQTVMRGERLTLSLEKAGWRTVEIRGPRQGASNVSLVQANANALPFADGSLSVVVTQYLTDLMGNPLWFAGEIRRVLEPNGIWINFSNPFPMPGEPEELGRPGLAEVLQLLEARGWRTVEAERHEFVLNDLHGVDPEAVRKPQEVHFFVAQNEGQRTPVDVARRWMRDAAWWQCTVSTVPGLEVKVLREEASGSTEGAAGPMLGIRGQTVPVTDEVAASVAGLFALLERGSTLEVVAAQLEELGIPLPRAELRELVHYLSEHYGFVRLTEPRSARSER